MTPLQIEILLHYHCTGGEDYRDLWAPAIKEAMNDFVQCGLLRPRALDPADPRVHPRYVAVREATQVYVDAICAIPLPVNRWVMPE